MPLQMGTKLGPYEIHASIGAGGMGEVYKAADTRLNRTVAIKVLPEHFSENPERKQRFEREAQTVAALNHPHICTLFDVGRQDGIEFLVMEYLEGETVAERVTRGPLPLDEALKVAIEIADALDKAHRIGVTHRDLKPGNVMLTSSGAKLLDFGLAKLKQTPRSAQSPQLPAPSPVQSPATTPGTILGTMQYMAPEQLEGKEADARSDIFSFGAILYEMVSGKRAFEGKSQAHLIAAIVSVDPPPLSKTQPMAPPALEFLVAHCLEKDPEQRLQTTWDLVCQLKWIAEGGTDTGIPAPLAAIRRRQSRMAQLGLIAAATVAAIVAIPAFLHLAKTTAPRESRFLIPVPDMPLPEATVVSPDGRSIAFSARDSGTTAVFVRPIGSDTALKLQGTEGAETLFWSPNSRSIAFFAGGKIKRVEASGGPPTNVADTPDMQGGTWNAADVILFASSKGLMRVPGIGGDPTRVETLPGHTPQSPHFLPDGAHFVYFSSQTSSKDPSAQPESAIYIASLGSGDATALLNVRSNAVYAEPGYLLYHREGTLYAHPFDPDSLKFTDDAIRIADNVPYGPSGAGAFSASTPGTLIYRAAPPATAAPGGRANASRVHNLPLVWVDRTNRKLEQVASSAGWAGVSLSPNGRRIAAHRHEGTGGDVWIFEPGQSAPAKFTFDATQDNNSPVWTVDGNRIAFASRRNGKWGIYIKLADNTREEELIVESDAPIIPMSWSRDGRTLVYWTSARETAGDIWGLPLSEEKKAFPILDSPADERHPQVSPDGKWIAYSSNETGRSEVYIRPFPGGTKIQVSLNGGLFPRWGRGGAELYFMNLISAGNLMVSDIRVSGASIQRGDPRVLFQAGFFHSPHAGGQYHPYSVSLDGQRFLMAQVDNPASVFTGRGANLGINPTVAFFEIVGDRHASSSPTANANVPINVVLNWTAALTED